MSGRGRGGRGRGGRSRGSSSSSPGASSSTHVPPHGTGMDDSMSEEDATIFIVNLDQGTYVDPDNGTWFDDNELQRTVADTLKANFIKYANTWLASNQEQRDRWWLAFRGQISFDSRREHLVREGFEIYSARRVTGFMHRARRDIGARSWMSPQVLEDFLKSMDTPEFRAKSAKTKQSRASGSSEEPGGKIPGTHGMGRRGFLKFSRDLDANREVPPSVVDLVTSSKKKKSGGFVSRKFEKVMDMFGSKKDKAIETQPDTPIDEARLYYEAAGGYDKKGRVYGLGSSAPLYYDKPASSRHSSAETYAPGIITRLTQQLEKDRQQYEKDRQQMEAERQVDRQKMADLEKFVYERLGGIPPGNCNPGTRQNRDDRSDFGPGGGDMGLGSTPGLTG